ncbi:MAG: ATP-binding protein [Oscillochloridaceae bacterium]|nr:ATP-binding protein [Chloroflexaceae bacterium]MDW8388764.1 ATP-binding protein [Oscillochloridaceae bacterium]
MFRGLRLQLTLLYTLAALMLVALVGGGSYLVVARYFQQVTDLALRHKMAHEFHALDAPLPADLVSADRDWSLIRNEPGLLPRRAGAPLSEAEAMARAVAHRGGGVPQRVEREEKRGREVYEVRFADGAEVIVDRSSGAILASEGGERRGGKETPLATPAATATPLAYDGELAAIFVLPLDTTGQVLFNPNPAAAPLGPDRQALEAALRHGSDQRTVHLSDGQRVRLLTYRLTRPDGPAALQLGRVLSDQDRVLWQLAVGLLVLGSLSMVLLGGTSWWLAGRALRPAQAAWERQQRFIASASHELRTPLTLIRASAEVALRNVRPEDADQRELLADVLSESDHMRRLVDDLLMLSRLDSGQLPLTLTTVDVAPFLAEVQRQVARLGTERGVTVRVEEASGAVCADADRLRQVLLIVLDNALRHTPSGGSITLAATPQGREVRFRVSDTGCGIAPEHLPHIFERFYRVDPARGRASGNAGLGLAIARALITAMGGQIGANSAPGQGTTVWFTLPGR